MEPATNLRIRDSISKRWGRICKVQIEIKKWFQREGGPPHGSKVRRMNILRNPSHQVVIEEGLSQNYVKSNSLLTI
jgi:hypothetical protein